MTDVPQPEIRSERLVLRPWQRADAEPLFALFNNWEIVRWLSLPPWPYTLDDARSYIEGTYRPSEEAAESYAVTLEGDVIGSIGVRMRPAIYVQRSAGPNFGFWIGQPYWRQGYMTEAVRALAWTVFSRGLDEMIYSGAFTGNVASLRVQEKAGFVRDGETTLYARPRGGEFPHVNTVLTRSRFERLAC